MPWGNAYYNSSLLDACPSEVGSGYDRQKFPCWAKLCNSTNAPKACFTGDKLCQHGPDECHGDSIEACAMHAYPAPSLYGPFVFCLEGQHGWWDGKAQKGGVNESFLHPCAKQAGIDAAPILHCLSDKVLQESLDREAARKTAVQAAKVPAAQWGTPFVLVNGVHLAETTELLTTVCNAWKAQDGALPAGCKQELSIWLSVETLVAFAAGLGAGLVSLLSIQCIFRRCRRKDTLDRGSSIASYAPRTNDGALLYSGGR